MSHTNTLAQQVGPHGLLVIYRCLSALGVLKLLPGVRRQPPQPPSLLAFLLLLESDQFLTGT